jgi:hypothetical protein
MAEAVIDFLEPVKIDDNDGKGFVILQGAIDLLVEGAARGMPVSSSVRATSCKRRSRR